LASGSSRATRSRRAAAGWHALFAAALWLAGACDARTRAGDPLVLSAASDLAAALPALTSAFRAETSVAVSTTVGSSGMLAQQILNGAPVDVFASADDSWVDRLEAAGRTVAGTRATYARGELALVLAPGLGRRAVAITDLASEEFRRIAIANPAFAPYGRAARQALDRGGVWEVVQPRVIMSENVRQALEYVVSGNVDAAIVARALVPAGTAWFEVPAPLYDPLLQDVVVIRDTRDGGAARRFVEFLTRGGGRTILRSYHFTIPDQTP
jgi:molybdate transport system substrate-binding protein